jgi:hypothetical protein
MKSKNVLLFSQRATIRPHPEPDKDSPRPPILFPKDPF